MPLGDNEQNFRQVQGHRFHHGVIHRWQIRLLQSSLQNKHRLIKHDNKEVMNKMAGHSSFCNENGAGLQWITCWDCTSSSRANGCGRWHKVLVSQSAASVARKRSSPDTEWKTSCEHSQKRQCLTTEIQCQRMISQPPTRQSNACCTVTCWIGHKTHCLSCWKPLGSHYSVLVVHWGESHACCCCAMVWCHTESLQAQDHRQHLPRIGSAATTSCANLFSTKETALISY